MDGKNNNKNYRKTTKDFRGDKNAYIPLSEVVEYTPYSQEYLSLRARQGKLKSVKVGRDWMTTINWVEKYLKEYNGVNGNGENSKKSLKGSFKTYGVLKYGAAITFLFLIIYLAASFQNFKPLFKSFSSSTDAGKRLSVKTVQSGKYFLKQIVLMGETAKDNVKFFSDKQELKARKIFLSSGVEIENILENAKDEIFVIGQTFKDDYKNKIENFNDGLSTVKSFMARKANNFENEISGAVLESTNIVKNFAGQGIKNLAAKTGMVTSQSKIIAKNFLNQQKNLLGSLTAKTKVAGNLAMGSLRPVKKLPDVLSRGESLAKTQTKSFSNDVKKKIMTLSRKTNNAYKLTINKTSVIASEVKNGAAVFYGKGIKKINNLAKWTSLSVSQASFYASRGFNDFVLGAENVVLGSKKIFLSAKKIALGDIIKSHNFVGEQLFAFQNSFRKNLFDGQKFIGNRFVVLGGIANNSAKVTKNYFNKSTFIAGNFIFQSFSEAMIFMTKGFINSKSLVFTMVSSINNFTRQISGKAVFGAGQALVAANNKFIGRPAGILSGSVYLGFEAAKKKINHNLSLAMENIKDSKKFFKQAGKDMVIPYFAFKESKSKIKDKTVLLADKTRKSTLNNFNKGRVFIGGQILAFKSSINKEWMNFSDKLSNGYLALLDYLIPERSFSAESLINTKRMAKKTETGVVVIPSMGGGAISSNKYLLSKIEESFSDEVKVEPAKNGKAGVIKPVNPAVPGEEYLYMIVPIKQ